MNKRAEFKKRNFELYLKKNVFSGKYVVRNILTATLAVGVVAGTVGITGAIKDAVKTRPQVKAAVQVVAEDSTQQAMADITLEQIPMLEDATIGQLLAGMDMNQTVDIASRQSEIVAYAPGDFDEKFVVIADDTIVYSEASETSAVAGRAAMGVVGDITSSDGVWVRVTSGDVQGYIKAECLLTGTDAYEFAKDYYTVEGVVNEDGVYVRKGASKDTTYVAVADKGDVYEVADVDTVGTDWVKVKLDDENDGYVYSELIDVSAGYPVAEAGDDVDNLPQGEGSITEIKATEKPSGSITAIPAKKPETTTEAQKPENTTEKQDTTTETTTETQETTAEDTSASSSTEVGTTSRGAFSFSEEDIILMACVVTLESGGESYEGQLAVANVILNRYESGRYGSTISDVVYAPYQFSVVGTDRFNTMLANSSPQSSCLQAVREACGGTNNIGSYKYFRPLYNANTASYETYTIIGNHVFF